MANFLTIVMLIPFLTGIATLLAWNWRPVQRALSLLGAAGLLGAGLALLAVVWREGVQMLQVGNWPAPFGIILTADLFSAIMVVLTGLMGLAVVLYSLGSIDPNRERFGYHPLLHILLMGVCGAFLTGDLFNLYVWFEVMLIASFVLMTLGGERAQLEGGIKYVALNLMASALFLVGVGLLYGVAGALNMADLARRLAEVERPGLMTAMAFLFLIAFGIKAALFPLFFWLPASYHTPPVAVTALFSGLLTKVGVYALIRVFTLLFAQEREYVQPLLLTVAGLTMVTGVLGAVAQMEMRRLLSFHIISQIGYLLMGLGLWTPAGLAGAVFFMAHVILAKAALFLVSGIVHHLRGTYDLKKLGGLYRTQPVLTILFLLPALSLAGLPPLSGFFAKLALVRAGLETGQFVIVAVALGVSMLTLFSMMKIWNEVFWKPSLEEGQAVPAGRASLALWLPLGLLAALTFLLGLAADPLFTLSLQAAEQLLRLR
ncbi:MAG: Na+/H+ antiporter subunit D [Anaerolineae bacterium]|nr:Na+/H+ antiporter subunit D [Anaerolineae bacterium]